MTLVVVILVLLLTLAFFYLKCSMMQSVMMLGGAVLATIIAFSYYEPAAELLISRGQGLDWALAGCFTILFIAAFAVFRAASDFLLPAPVDLGNGAKAAAALICGLLTGVILSGNLLVALGLLPMHGKIFYSQFDPDAPVVADAPRTPLLKTDGFVTGLYSWISSGSMRSGQSFGVLHADYLSQIHLNKLKTQEDVLTVCSRESLVLPRGKAKKTVRRITVDDAERVLVRVGVQAKKIADGGANNTSGRLAFFPAQIRLIVKEADAADPPLVGTATALYPVGFWNNGVLTTTELNEPVAPSAAEINNRVYWMDVVFACPKNKKPVLLEFKQNAVIQLPEAVNSTPEIERALDDEGQKEEVLSTES